MAKTKLVFIHNLGEQAWECPFCHRGNGVPEVTECVCGAVRVGDHAEAPGAAAKPGAAAGAVTTTDGGSSEAAADEG